MRSKSPKCKLKDKGLSSPLSQKHLVYSLSTQTANLIVRLCPKKAVENVEQSQSKQQVSIEKPTGSVEVTDPSNFIHYSYSDSKDALLSAPLVQNVESMSLHHNNLNCLSIWKKIGSMLTHESTSEEVETLTFDAKSCSTEAVPDIQAENGIGKINEPAASEVYETVQGHPFLPPWRCFTIQEMISATKNFHPDNIVGKGGYAKVYRGTLSDGKVIAIKRLNQCDSQDHKEKDFLVEIGIMAHVCHPNTTPLVGFCLEGGLYLIYNFYPHGSLAGILHGSKLKAFDWPLRFKVAIGTARGLLYLHEQCRRRIIHRDIKASNILLDADFEPQISDFGLAKWLPREWTHHSVSPIEGTFGYLAPEYHMHGIVDEKTDIYSFGVLLLEIISGRRAVADDQKYIVDWARPLLEAQNIPELADPELRGSFDYHQMYCMAMTADKCIRHSAISRPTMSQVLKLLEG